MYPGPKPPGQKSPVSIGDGLHWKHVGEFTLLQAACLWAGIEPLDSFQDLQRTPEATARYLMLTRAIEAGDLEASHQNPAPRTIKLAAGGSHAPDMLVSRADLEVLAISVGEQPLFLFPASAHKTSISKPGRRPDRRDAAKRAMKDLYPDGVPTTLKRDALTQAVNDYLRSEGIVVSPDTCDRAKRELEQSQKVAN
jgi:hypothetical protein